MRGHINNTHMMRASAVAIIAAMACASGAAQAQTAGAKPAASQLDEVVVTGSRIRGVAPVGSPLIAVNREDIKQSSAVTTAQLLQELPQIFNLGVSENSRGQSGGSGNITYGSSVNIRGIGPYATLAIIDGHRAVPQGTTGFAVDPSVLPTIMLERVDVVADGASAIYGSDAVAGVVNLILRRNVEGVEANARVGYGSNYDERQVGLILGHRWSSGQFTIAYENGFHSALSGKDRDFYGADLRGRGGNDYRPTLCDPGNIVIGGVSYAIPTGGVTKANASSLVAGTSNKCDTLKVADLLPRQNHNSVAFTANQAITDRISFFADGFAVRRDFKNRTGYTASSVTVPSTNAFFVTPVGLTPTSETLQYSFGKDYPQGYSSGFSQAVNATVGFDVKLPHDWKFETDYTWGRDDDLSKSRNTPNAAALTAALASNNPATAFNPYGAANSQSVVNGILIGGANNKGRTIFQGYEAKLDGALFALPGGEVRAAIGYEGQRQTVDQLNVTFVGAAGSGLSRFFTRGVNSFYGELLVPLVGSGNAMTGVQGLDVDLAVRRDKYSDVGGTTNPKVGVNWKPVEDLTIHGSWGKSFRAPTISQIYGNTNTLFIQNYADPTCSCIRQGVTRSGGNLNLKPETARTWSIGADFAPHAIPGLRFSATYFDINYKNQVTSYLADLTILNREAQFAGTGIIVRNPSTALIAAQVAETGFTGIVPSPATLFVEGRSSNLGVTIAKGFDFQGSYRIPTDNWGDFLVSISGTRFTDYKTAITPAAPLLDNLNVIYNPLKFKGRASLRWNDGPWSGSAAVNYQNAYINNLVTPSQTISAYASVDLHMQYAIGQHFGAAWVKNATVGIDVTNLFDKDPPFANIAESANGGGGFDPTLVSPVGRIISFSLGTKF